MNGREVFKFAVRIMGEASTRVVDKAGLQSDDTFILPFSNSCEILKGIEAADVLPNRLTDTLIFSLYLLIDLVTHLLPQYL
jgi:hypothetical protein